MKFQTIKSEGNLMRLKKRGEFATKARSVGDGTGQLEILLNKYMEIRL